MNHTAVNIQTYFQAKFNSNALTPKYNVYLHLNCDFSFLKSPA